MRAEEASGLGRWAGGLLRGTTRAVQGVHTAIGKRGDALAEYLVGPDAAPFVAIRRGVTDAVYGAVGLGLDATARVVGAVAATRVGDESSVTERPAAHGVLALINGWHGDRLWLAGSPLSLTMSLRSAGRDLEATPEGLRAAYPTASGRLAVFVHGLAETEDYWRYRAADRFGDARVSYGSMLAEDLGYTPLWVRYNTGRRISDNGALLAALLADVVAGWPVPVETIALIGHSMGGLVVHSALAQGSRGGQPAPWLTRVHDTISIATPHDGAHLEQHVAAVAAWAGRSESLAWLAAALRARSLGIKDLRHGNLVPDDWIGHDPDDPARHRTEVPLPARVAHHLTLSTVTTDTEGPIGARVGDLLVRPSSGRGGPGGGRFADVPPSSVHILGGLHHFDLLNHPAVYAQIRAWLTRPPAGSGQPGTTAPGAHGATGTVPS